MKQIQNKILTWYKLNKRDLPWRKTTDPYKILISEIMLQQTQVDRVIPYYLRFLKKFPDFKKLARARKPTLLKYWSGLGYNSRVLRLQLLAKKVVKEYKEKFLNPYEAAKQGKVDIITEPKNTRKTLVSCLEMLMTKRERRPAKKHGNIPL